MECSLKRYAAGLIAALVVVGFWAVVGPDGLANAQTGCVSQGAVSASETALAADCEVLLDVRDTLLGTGTLNWAADTPIEDWDGISVGGTPMRVISISLGGRGLSGTIPGELGNLSSLTYLDLSFNQLAGTIPSELSNLSKLTGLDLGGNELTGTIPSELGGLFNLTGLNLSRNQLTGTIPPQLGDLSNLIVLWLLDNQLTGTIPPQLGNLSNLINLWLWDNQLTGTIPAELGDLASLRELMLWGNQLSGTIPTQLGNLSNLTDLWLRDNQLSGTIPGELGSLSNLTDLWLNGNQLSGTIPGELGNLSNLMVLSLWDNQLSGTIPSELGSLSNLRYLWLSQNELRGDIPDILTRLTSLERLAFFSNAGLCAPVDNAFQTWLQGIDTVHGSSCAPVDSQEDRAVLADLYSATDGANWEDNSNWLSNRPIREWYGVTNDADGRVTGIYLWENRLSGSIPPELSNLSKLEGLYLHNNQLTGSIPPELGNLPNLSGLYLRDNQMAGCIPAALQRVVSNDLDELGLPFCDIPTVIITIDSANYQVRINSPIPVTATFSEPVSGFTVSDVSVANGSADNFGGGGGSVYTFDVAPNAIGVVTVDIAAGVAEDSEGNGNTTAVQLTLGLPYDDDRDGAISREEVITAIGDYLFGGILTRDEVIQIIGLYLFG